MIFMGEEWAASTPWQFFTDFTDEGMAEAVRAGRRAEFGVARLGRTTVPDPQARSTRDASVLRWEELSAEPHASLLGWYRSSSPCAARSSGRARRGSPTSPAPSRTVATRFVMTHRGLTVHADLAHDTVTVSTTDGRPDLVDP